MRCGTAKMLYSWTPATSKQVCVDLLRGCNLVQGAKTGNRGDCVGWLPRQTCPASCGHTSRDTTRQPRRCTRTQQQQKIDACAAVLTAAVAAVYRGARAALKLGEWGVCRQLVQQGLDLEPGAQQLLQIQQVGELGATCRLCDRALSHTLVTQVHLSSTHSVASCQQSSSSFTEGACLQP
jgi:hypothetical protein